MKSALVLLSLVSLVFMVSGCSLAAPNALPTTPTAKAASAATAAPVATATQASTPSVPQAQETVPTPATPSAPAPSSGGGSGNLVTQASSCGAPIECPVVAYEKVTIEEFRAEPRSSDRFYVYGRVHVLREAQVNGITDLGFTVNAVPQEKGGGAEHGFGTSSAVDGNGYAFFGGELSYLDAHTRYGISLTVYHVEADHNAETLTGGYTEAWTLKTLTDRKDDVLTLGKQITDGWKGLKLPTVTTAIEPTLLKSYLATAAQLLTAEESLWFEATYGDIGGQLAPEHVKAFLSTTKPARAGVVGIVTMFQDQLDAEALEWETFGVPVTVSVPVANTSDDDWKAKVVQERVAKAIQTAKNGYAKAKIVVDMGTIKYRAMVSLIFSSANWLEKTLRTIDGGYYFWGSENPYPHTCSVEFPAGNLTQVGGLESEAFLDFYSANQLSRDPEVTPKVTDQDWQLLKILKGFFVGYRSYEVRWLKSLDGSWSADRNTQAQYMRQQYIEGWKNTSEKGKAKTSAKVEKTLVTAKDTAAASPSSELKKLIEEIAAFRAKAPLNN